MTDRSEVPIHVLMVHGWWDSTRLGGILIMIQTLSQALSPDHRTTLLTNDWDAPDVRPAGQHGDMDIFALRLRRPSEGGAKGRVLWWLNLLPTLLKLRRFMRSRRIDVVHLHYPSSYQAYFPMLRRLFGIPYIVTLHGGDIHEIDRKPPREQAALRRILRGASRINGVSKALAAEVRSFDGANENIGAIYNRLPPALLVDIKRQAAAGGPPPDLPSRYFAIVGNFHKVKGHDLAIDAWGRVGEKHPDVALVIVGDGPEREAYESRIAAAGLSESVVLTGAMDRAGVISVIAGCEGFIVPSRHEGLGLVLMEAGAVGVPLICTDMAPFTELVSHEDTAFLVPPESPAAIADAVCRALDNPEVARAMGARLKEAMAPMFDADRMAAEYLAAYRDASAGR